MKNVVLGGATGCAGTAIVVTPESLEEKIKSLQDQIEILNLILENMCRQKEKEPCLKNQKIKSDTNF